MTKKAENYKYEQFGLTFLMNILKIVLVSGIFGSSNVDPVFVGKQEAKRTVSLSKVAISFILVVSSFLLSVWVLEATHKPVNIFALGVCALLGLRFFIVTLKSWKELS